MYQQIQFLKNQWLSENCRVGALGIIIRDYLTAHATTLLEYEKFIEHWLDNEDLKIDSKPIFEDWYQPSLVEFLIDWSYDENIFYRHMSQSPHAKYWRVLFPHAFLRMPAFDLAAAFRWEPLLKTWPDEVRAMFYKQLDATVSKTFVSIELNRSSLPKINLVRLLNCLNPVFYTSYENEAGKPWHAIWALLQHDDWRHYSEEHFKNLSHLWIQYAPILNVSLYIDNASLLLRHSTIQWQPMLLDSMICRVRNIYSEGASSILLKNWTLLRNRQTPKEKKIPWVYVLKKWTTWDYDTLLEVVNGLADWQQELQELVLEHSNYELHIKKKVLLYRCENDLIVPRDIEICKALPKELQHILMFWLLYRDRTLNKEFIKVFQSRYHFHPVYEKENIMAVHLPGFSGIRAALRAMNTPWAQAFHYAEDAMRSNEATHGQIHHDFVMNYPHDLFETQCDE